MRFKDFKEFGEIKGITAEEFYSLNASVYRLAEGEDGEMYDIVLIINDDGSQEFAYSNI